MKGEFSEVRAECIDRMNNECSSLTLYFFRGGWKKTDRVANFCGTIIYT